jgi:hypothetical protein
MPEHARVEAGERDDPLAGEMSTSSLVARNTSPVASRE